MQFIDNQVSNLSLDSYLKDSRLKMVEAIREIEKKGYNQK